LPKKLKEPGGTDIIDIKSKGRKGVEACSVIYMKDCGKMNGEKIFNDMAEKFGW